MADPALIQQLMRPTGRLADNRASLTAALMNREPDIARINTILSPNFQPQFGTPFVDLPPEDAARQFGMMGMVTPAVGTAKTLANVLKATKIAEKSSKAARAAKIAALRAEGNATRFGDAAEYRGVHKAPARAEANTLDNLAGVYPDDIYNPAVSGRFYGHGGPSQALDNETARILANFRNKPDATVEVFRAVPKGVKTIQPDDWVTINRNYAASHGKANLGADFHIISKKVKASEVTSAGDSIHEFGYSPLNVLKATKISREVPLGTSRASKALQKAFLYHGTNAKVGPDFKFDLSKIGSATDDGWLGKGIYWSPGDDVARVYGKNVIKATVDLKNPFRFPKDVNPIKFVKEKGGSEAFTKWAKAQGHDGVISDNILVQTVAFDPSSIKIISTSGR